MPPELALLFFFVLLASIGTPISAQPTTIDFDFCEDGVALRHVIRNLQVLTEETKATRLSLQSLQQSVESKFEKIETVLNEVEKSNIADRHFQHQTSDRITQMDTSTRITLQELGESIHAGISRQTSDMQMIITNSTVHESKKIGSEITDVMEASQMDATRNLNVTISKLEDLLDINKQYYNDQLEDLKQNILMSLKNQTENLEEGFGKVDQAVAFVGERISHLGENVLANSTASVMSYIYDTVRNSTSDMANEILIPLEELRNDGLAAVNRIWQRLSTNEFNDTLWRNHMDTRGILDTKMTTNLNVTISKLEDLLDINKQYCNDQLKDLKQNILMSLKNQAVDLKEGFGKVDRTVAFVGKRISDLGENVLANSTKSVMSYINDTVRNSTSDMANEILVPLKELRNDGLAAVNRIWQRLSTLMKEKSMDISKNISLSLNHNTQFLLDRGKVEMPETVQSILLNISRDVLSKMERNRGGASTGNERTGLSPLGQTGAEGIGLNVANIVFRFLRLIQEKQTTVSDTLLSNVSSSITRILQQTVDEASRSLELTNEKVVTMVRNIVTAPQNGNIRLVNGTGSMDGRVELYVGGVWGTVCDDGWGDTDARVVCRQLAFCDGTAYNNISHYGRGVDPIYLDDVECTGAEHSLLRCPSNSFGSHNCGHGEDAGVKCTFCPV